jgi:EAL domain-containing protein (putative c-di-GMP-specific phosphodiesterase class I)
MNIDLIKKIIKEQFFTNFFQPIYHLVNQKVLGYESLFRCTLVKNPEHLFNYALQHGLVHELDTASITNSLREFKKYHSHHLFLSLNVYPSTISMSFFTQFLEELVNSFSIPSRQIVLEINESERLTNLDKLSKSICSLQEKGFLIALDDFGKGEYSFHSLTEINPDIIKLDRCFAKNLANDPKKQEALLYTLNLLGENNKIILEGIETEEDMRCAKSLGVSYGQGYYFAKPLPLHMINVHSAT